MPAALSRPFSRFAQLFEQRHIRDVGHVRELRAYYCFTQGVTPRALGT
jgi:hypothetical protein